MIQLFVAIGSIALLFLFDYGGYYYYDYYYSMDVWGYISFTSGIIPAIVILIGAAGFLISARSAVLTLNVKPLTEQALKENATKSIQGAAIPVVLSIISFLVFLLTNLGNSWWLDTAFYAGLLGGALIIIFSKLTLNMT
jgi:hypothetical protein